MAKSWFASIAAPTMHAPGQRCAMAPGAMFDPYAK